MHAKVSFTQYIGRCLSIAVFRFQTPTFLYQKLDEVYQFVNSNTHIVSAQNMQWALSILRLGVHICSILYIKSLTTSIKISWVTRTKTMKRRLFIQISAIDIRSFFNHKLNQVHMVLISMCICIYSIMFLYLIIHCGNTYQCDTHCIENVENNATAHKSPRSLFCNILICLSSQLFSSFKFPP